MKNKTLRMYKKFETDRLILKPTTKLDSELIFRMMNAPKFKKYVGDRNIFSIKSAENYIEGKMTPQLEMLGYSNYTIILKQNDIKIGVCGLYNRGGVDGVDIGFGILPSHEGLGYAFEAANRLKQVAFKNFNIQSIKAITSKENISSQKILNKLNMNLVGTTQLPGENKEILLYEIDLYNEFVVKK
ncbi:GNAT family N-acetyltransferase [Hwangdonia lutea]|uniref:GNAT family N-acetyltransferase n=1 Tax=Hwangdonia lutea TaxID=3075823 RepID=A0AA97EM91_9FLAO|nr:GNAT family N-acetyltransferase [Hwangdonia sp. SCSIO 19198]WOD43536.1 GNAT family N-acetyltransferase [Hwangdonia sp. SCSIO 19198]